MDLISVFVFHIASINGDGELGGDLGVEFDLNHGFAGFFDRLVELDRVAIDDDAGRFELFVDVHVGDRSESFATLTGGEGEVATVELYGRRWEAWDAGHLAKGFLQHLGQ